MNELQVKNPMDLSASISKVAIAVSGMKCKTCRGIRLATLSK